MRRCCRCGGTKFAKDGSCNAILYYDRIRNGVPVYCGFTISANDSDPDVYYGRVIPLPVEG
jgi:hypothetical protein